MKNKIEKIMKSWYHGKGVYDIEGIAFDIEELIDEECFEERQKAFKSALRAERRYPVFANPTIGSISYRDWLKKQLLR